MTLPLRREDLELVLRPLEHARGLPRAAFVDPAVLELELREWFGGGWVCVGRSETIAAPGAWMRAPPPLEVLAVRGDDGALRAFHNSCQHRGSALVDGDRGACVRLRCPYHGWVYDSNGRLVAAGACEMPGGEISLARAAIADWQGFVFVSADPAPAPLAAHLDDLVDELADLDLTRLKEGRCVTYEVRANWKLVMENFLESDHFAFVHPELERLTPSRRADSIPSRGAWQGGVMPLADGVDTVSEDGRRHERQYLGEDPDRRREVRDYMVWPNLFASLQPDYLLTYAVWPFAIDRTRIVHTCSFAAQESNPTDVYSFWDRTNAQDLRAVELQQLGVSSRAFTAGRYTPVEDGVQVFDRLAARRYLEALAR